MGRCNRWGSAIGREVLYVGRCYTYVGRCFTYVGRCYTYVGRCGWVLSVDSGMGQRYGYSQTTFEKYSIIEHSRYGGEDIFGKAAVVLRIEVINLNNYYWQQLMHWLTF